MSAGLVLSLAAPSPSDTVGLMVDYVPPALLESPVTNQPPTAAIREVVLLSKPPGMSWQKFEAEFGIKDQEPLSVKNSLRAAKYELDQTTYALQEFVDNVESRLRFDYGLNGSGPPARATPPATPRTGMPYFLTDAIRNTRLQSDINLRVNSKPFIGVKLVLPIGN